MRNTLIALGIALILCGLLWPWICRIPLGRLPGDIFIDRPGFKVFVPLTSMIIVSIVLSVIFWFFRK